MKNRILILIFLILFTGISQAAAPSRTYNYVLSTVIDPTQVNTNETSLYTYLQSGVDTYSPLSINNAAVSSSAAISYTKLNLTNSILGSDINSSAAIPYSKLSLAGSILNSDLAGSITDSNLNQITTASKVSGTAITGLASLPVGAGVIPTGNLGSGTANNTTFLRGDQTYAAVPAQKFTLVSVTSITGSTTTGSISITSGNTYFVVYNFTNFQGASLREPMLRFNGDSGSNYKWINGGWNTTGVLRTSNTNDIKIKLGSNATQTTGSYNGSFYIMQTSSSSKIYQIWGSNVLSSDADTGLFTNNNTVGIWNNSANATSISFSHEDGSSAMDGVVYLYQLSTS